MNAIPQPAIPQPVPVPTIRDDLALAFNEWMRRYVADPEEFDREFQSVARFVLEGGSGTPSYGTSCAAYLEQLLSERQATT